MYHISKIIFGVNILMSVIINWRSQREAETRTIVMERHSITNEVGEEGSSELSYNP